MSWAHAWVRRFGEGHSSGWRSLVKGLRLRIALEEEPNPAVPGLLLLEAVSEEALEQVASQRQSGAAPIIAFVSRRSDLGKSGAWRLMQAGAGDVLVLEELDDPAGAVLVRLERLAQIEELAESQVVKENLVGESDAWRRVIRQAVEIARFSNAPLLITGESGTGKELIARLVHTLDPRPDKGKLAVLDCTTVTPELSGSEFFGHERGAFTNAVAVRDGVLALAHKGSLFLDEVGELPLSLQAELLRAVQERTYKRVGSNAWQQADFRLICATNRDLEREKTNGSFRLDFYHRIACSRCHLPPLRERVSDILPLARHFLRQVLKDERADFDPGVQDLLLARDYPGNVRELRQLVLRIARRHVGSGYVTMGAIPDEDRSAALALLGADWRGPEFQQTIRRALAGGAGLQDIKDQTVDAVIQIALNDAAGNIQSAAIKLGVTDRALQMRRAAQKEAQENSTRFSPARAATFPELTDRESAAPLEPPGL